MAVTTTNKKTNTIKKNPATNTHKTQNDIENKIPKVEEEIETTKDAIIETENPISEVDEKSNNKKIPKLDDDVLIKVKSNVYGFMLYKNHKTGDRTEWANFGDIQDMTMGDLRAMKAGSRAFFEDCMIYLLGVNEDGYEYITSEDLYKMLNVSHYYKDILDIDSINDIFLWSDEDIELKIPNMTQGLKSSIIIAANTMIEEGKIDSISKIKVLEKALSCELANLSNLN